MINKKTLLLFSLLGLAPFAGLHAQAPEKSEDVMLQGFYWDSQKETGWTQLMEQTEAIGRSFTCIWLPPSASPEGGGAVGGTNVGYHPREWSNQNSCWGTSDGLKSLIAALHEQGVKVLADIVINHRAGNTDWGNFTADNFGEYGNFQLTADHICRTDEMNTDPAAGKWNGTAKGAADTGENWGGARDLDHTSAYVQDDCKAYLNWLHGEYGYDGWRYDFCKGFSGEYVGLYNDASRPYISVGEYWDGGYDPVAAWIEKTGRKSMAFDFPMKYAALNNGLSRGNFSNMSWIEDNTTWRPAGMIHHHNYNRYSVTFVDNHDTYRDSNKFTGDVGQAYAFILAAPGIPCVFWPHWTGSKKADIEAQIEARHAAGIHSQSDCEVTVRSKYYESVTHGEKGTLICRIGGASMPREVPSGYFLACSGTGWAYYLSETLAGVEAVEAASSITLRGDMLHVASSAPQQVSVYTVDGRLVNRSYTADLHLSLPCGMYVVQAGSETRKLSVLE